MEKTGKRERNKRFRKSQSMMRSAIEFMIPVCILFALLLLFMFRSVNEAREMAYRYMQDMAMVNAARVNEDISKINSEMVYLIQQDKNIDALPGQITPQETEYYKLLEDIVSLNKTLRIRYGGTYFFYEYVDTADFLILDNHPYFPVSIKSAEAIELRKMIKGYLSGEIKRSEWNYFTADGKDYLFCFYETGGKAVGCIIALEDLFTSFNISNLGYEGIPFLVINDGEILLYGQEEEKQTVIRSLENHFCKSTVYSYQLGRVGRLNLLIASTEGILEKIMALQIANSILAVSIVLVIAVITFIY